MKPTCILSETHGLLPLAAKLRAEGHSVEWAPWQDRFRAAWAGSLPAMEAAPDLDAALAGELRVLSDSPSWSDRFFAAKDRFFGLAAGFDPSPLRIAGWWDGEYLHAPHLLVVDLGAWTGGLGSRMAGGATLIAGFEKLAWDSFAPSLDALKSSGHRGLVAGHLDQNLAWLGYSGGWESLHLHAWLASCETPLGELLDGAEPKLRSGATVVLPVTIPPWPATWQGIQQPVAIDREQAKRVFWHDVHVVDAELRTAGLDGFVAVVHGAAQSLMLSRRRALEAAGAIGLSEKQLRIDVGAAVETIIVGLEAAGFTP